MLKPRRTSFYLPPACFLGLGLVLVLARPATALDYKRDIMPIFEEKCFDCHGGGKSKGGLKLDDPSAFYKRFAKNSVVVPGDWDGSYLFVAVSRPPGSKDSMPPKAKKGDGKSLTPEEVMKVAEWIYEGATIDGERGEKGDKDDNPKEFIKFRDGLMLTDSADVHVEEESDEMGKKEPEPQEWTNAEGKKIEATYKGTEGDRVILLLKGGKSVKYPIENLSEKSQEAVAKLKEKFKH